MIAGVVLAAGESRRMGRSKPLVARGGESFLAHSIRRLWTCCDHVVVVLGKEGRRVRAAAEEEFGRLAAGGELRPDLAGARRRRPGTGKLEVHFVVNPDYRKGMVGSVRTGLRAALRLRPAAVLVGPVDQPAVRAQTVAAIAGAMEAAVSAYAPRGGRAMAGSGFAYAIVPRHRGRRGHPVALTAALARAVVRDRNAADLSDAIRRGARLVGYLDVTDRGVVENVNSPRPRR